MILTIIIFIFTLLVLVTIHELGHFLVAKRFGIKVLEFGFGIPPRIWGKKIGETIYSLNWLPIGGFVRLFGEDETDKNILENHRSFAAQNVWKRIAVVVAGVGMNFLLAFLLLYITLGFAGFKAQVPFNEKYQFVGVNQSIKSLVVITKVFPDSPAEKAGIRSGDRVVSINGTSIQTSEQMVLLTKKLVGEKLNLLIETGQDQKKIVSITPRQVTPTGEGPLGVALYPVRIVNISYDTPVQRLFSGPIHAWNVIAYSGVTLGDLIGQSFNDKNIKPLSATVAGPVGITNLANSILTQEQNPLIPYLSFVALISLNLAVFNLLPIPALDGGRLFFLLFEGITRRKVKPELERTVHNIGMALLLTLTLLITFSDIKKIF